MTDPVPLRTGVDRLLAHLDAPAVATVDAVFAHWPEMVGPGIADHSRPLSIDDRCLVVGVTDPTWASHLQWSQDDLLERLAAAVGSDAIDRIRIVVRPPR